MHTKKRRSLLLLAMMVAVPLVAQQQNATWGPVTYKYDGAGNVSGIGNNYYLYDGVGRLATASTNGVAQTFTYDRFGNLKKVEVPNQTALSLDVDPQTNRLLSASGPMSATFGYDQAGNLTSDGTTNYRYDALGTMISGQDTYLYDAEDERVAVLGSDGVNRYALRGLNQQVLREIVDDPAHAARWTWSKDYVYRNGQLLAEVMSTGAGAERRHYHVDHLGSPRLITADGAMAARLGTHEYYPFGAEVPGGSNERERMRFTGHERDGALDYMHARYYASAWGRFLSIDWHAASSAAPQSWNRYAYARNNPISFNDPDGNLEVIAYYTGLDHPIDYQVAFYTRMSVLRDKFEAKAKAKVDETFPDQTPDIKWGTLVFKAVEAVSKLTRGISRTDPAHLKGVKEFTGLMGKYDIGAFEAKVQEKFEHYAKAEAGLDRFSLPGRGTAKNYDAEQVMRLQRAIDDVLDEYVAKGTLKPEERDIVRAEYDVNRMMTEAEDKARKAFAAQFLSTGQGQ